MAKGLFEREKLTLAAAGRATRALMRVRAHVTTKKVQTTVVKLPHLSGQ